MMKFIDLFAGGGGLSEGFISAGFEPVAHVEIDRNACKTIQTRLIYHQLKQEKKIDYYHDYLLGKISRENFVSSYDKNNTSQSVLNISIDTHNNQFIFAKIDKLLKRDKIDLIIGGPPCQAYSLVGRARDKNSMVHDPRNFFYKEYAKFLKYYQPKIFIFENVLGVITAGEGSYFKNM